MLIIGTAVGSAYVSGQAGVSAPVNTVAPTVSGSVPVGSTLTSTTGTWDNVPVSYSYQWTRDGVPIGGATNSTYVSQAADHGTVIRCEVSATNAGGTGGPVASSNSITPIAAPVNSVAPTVSGSVAIGSTLTSTTGTWTNSPSSYTYQWTRDGVDISGATNSTYVSQAADGGTAVRCKVSATNAGGTGGPVTSSNSISVLAIPTNSVAPVISGTNKVGQTLSSTTGTWSGATSYTYQWTRNGANISGATSSTYTLVTADAGTAIQCKVAGVNASGTATAVASNTINVLSDAFASSVKFLVNFEGANNATTATDEGPNNQTMTFGGNAKITTSESYSASYTSCLTLDGSSDHITALDIGAWWVPSNQPWTIEIRARNTHAMDSFGAIRFMWAIATEGGGTQYQELHMWPNGANGNPAVRYFDNRTGTGFASRINLTGQSADFQAWHEWAISFDGTTLWLYKDGTMVGSNVPSQKTVQSAAGMDLRIGGRSGDANEWQGRIQAMRMTAADRFAGANYTPAAKWSLTT